MSVIYILSPDVIKAVALGILRPDSQPDITNNAGEKNSFKQTVLLSNLPPIRWNTMGKQADGRSLPAGFYLCTQWLEIEKQIHQPTNLKDCNLIWGENQGETVTEDERTHKIAGSICILFTRSFSLSHSISYLVYLMKTRIRYFARDINCCWSPIPRLITP